MIHLILLGFLVYLLYAWLCYDPDLKSAPWFVPAALACALLANFLWILVSKKTSDSSDLLRYALYWDVSVAVSSLVVPLVLFDARLSPLGWVGMGFVVTGVWLLKVS